MTPQGSKRAQPQRLDLWLIRPKNSKLEVLNPRPEGVWFCFFVVLYHDEDTKYPKRNKCQEGGSSVFVCDCFSGSEKGERLKCKHHKKIMKNNMENDVCERKWPDLKLAHQSTIWITSSCNLVGLPDLVNKYGWKLHHLQMYLLLERNFHCYVSLLECRWMFAQRKFLDSGF